MSDDGTQQRGEGETPEVGRAGSPVARDHPKAAAGCYTGGLGWAVFRATEPAPDQLGAGSGVRRTRVVHPRVRGTDGFSAPLTATKGLKRVLFYSPSGIVGDWWWQQEHTRRLIEIEEAIYQWRLPQIRDMIRKRLDET